MMELLTEQQISVEMINNFSDEETPLSFISLASDTDAPTTVAPNYVETTSNAPTFIAQEPCTSTSQALPSRNETVSLSRAAHVVFSQEAGLSSVEASLPGFPTISIPASSSSSSTSPLAPFDISPSPFSSNPQTHDQEPAHHSQLTTTKRKRKEAAAPKSTSEQMMKVAQDAFSQLNTVQEEHLRSQQHQQQQQLLQIQQQQQVINELKECSKQNNDKYNVIGKALAEGLRTMSDEQFFIAHKIMNDAIFLGNCGKLCFNAKIDI